MASNASGNQSDSAQTWDSVNSGQSDDIENSLTGQGTSDRETTREVDRDEAVEERHHDGAHADDGAEKGA
ncbi:hypothetical protein GCM10009840_05100 [Pseudolysinimonas kribbensis]|jgi:hypothetical protein|uniref:Uncharacterized protein n=1 Tax=Pseudolysinimonas kribbensis TaxID=433641 RepID=A0ABQ6K7R4_9MICO|nr:hypothetical protein [Pseudolysinimonas kribbensis]GMA94847.1 hypothetical protein GCM10025881_16710 [Pseudolysinimonas kribbensis]